MSADVRRSIAVSTKAFLTTGPPPTRTPRKVVPTSVTAGARLVLNQPEGFLYDWRGITNPYWWDEKADKTWPVGDTPPAGLDTHRAILTLLMCPEIQWYRWKIEGDSAHPVSRKHAYEIPTRWVWIE